jgi:trigger factor
MNITKTNTDDVNAILKVAISKEDYLPKVEKALQDYRKKVTLKGFRVGHVPANLIKKMYGNAILFEEVNKATSEALNNYIKDEKLDILGQPIPLPVNNDVSIDIYNPADISFDFEIGLVPDFSIADLKKTTIKGKSISVSDKDLDKEINDIATRYGDVENPEDTSIQEKDILTLDIKELDGDNIKESGLQNTAVINEEMIKDKKIKKSLAKLKVGNSFKTNIFTLIDRDREEIIHQVLGVKNDGNHNHEDIAENYEITISKISRMKKAEINQALFDKVYGEGVIATEAEFRDKIKQEIENYTKQIGQNTLRENIYTHLIENTNLNLPVEFLKKFIKSSNEKPLTDEQIETEYPSFEKGLRWNLITAKIAKDNDIKVEFDDVKAYSKEQIKKQFAMYAGAGGLDDKTLDMLNENMLKKEEHVRKSYDATLEQKLFDYLISQVNITEEVTTFEDYINQSK